MNLFSPARRIKRDVMTYSHALARLNQGDTQPAIDAIQLGSLPEADLKRGCIARLKASMVRAYIAHTNVPRAQWELAVTVLATAGQPWSPPY